MTESPGIPMGDLIDGNAYRIRSRNLAVGMWRAESKGFLGIRTKFDNEYLFEEFHYDNGPPLGTAWAEGDLGPVPLDMRSNDNLFGFLLPLNEQVHEGWRREDEAAEAQRASEAYAPMTFEQSQREERRALASQYLRIRREAGAAWEETIAGFQEILAGREPDRPEKEEADD